jgi:gamma-glutamyltranspeptidase/glutathione hydrolase
MALGILRGFEFDMHGSIDTCHKQLEAIKLAFADGHRYIADPQSMDMDVEALLSEDYLSQRRKLIGAKSKIPAAGDPHSGGTVYLCTADAEGNMVSFIQSNYNEFGSGIVIPGTGIALHNRGANFSLTPGHSNCLEPGKRPYHTIIPGFLTRNGQAVGPFGVMGAFMQPQGHLQVIMNSIDFNMNPQQALDAPRWQWTSGKEVDIETGFSGEIAYSLLGLGHNIRIASSFIPFGRGQIIWREDNGVLTGATDPRADGCVAAW